jgi:hypothetical protein
MQTTIEATFAQHLGNVALTSQKLAGVFEVPGKTQCGDNRSGHDFCISHLALWIFVMSHSFEHIVTQAKDCYNLVVHVFSWVSRGLGTNNFTRKHMDLLIRSSQGSNLGYLFKTWLLVYL